MSKIEKIDKNSTKTTTNFLYDENGNLLKDASHEYIYDKKARLVGVDNNVSYAYNHENTRVSKTVNAQMTHFIYDGAKLIGEYNSDGTPKNEYIYLNGTPLAVTNATKNLYIHTDHLGTPRRLADENANIVWSWESKAFGDDEAVGSVKFDLRFAGQYYDDETSTHYNINRDYDPKMGRYLQSDPIGFDGGVNSYGYVGGNPMGAVDEMGLFVDTLDNPLMWPIAFATGLTWGINEIAERISTSSFTLNSPKDNNRGRIQIQDNKGYEDSIAWHGDRIPTKKEGRIYLAKLENRAKVKYRKMYDRLTTCGSFDNAVIYINKGPLYGIGASKSITCGKKQINGERIDFEIISGSAFK